VIAFPVNVSEVLEVLNQDVDANAIAALCLEHEPNDRDSVLSYSVCRLANVPTELAGSDVETWPTDIEFFMPEDCSGGETVEFEVAPDETKICVDVSDILLQLSPQVPSGGGDNRSLQPSLDPVLDVFLMIDSFESTNSSFDEEGDRFYSSEDDEGRQPVLSILVISLSVNETDPVETTSPTPVPSANDNSISTPTLLPTETTDDAKPDDSSTGAPSAPLTVEPTAMPTTSGAVSESARCVLPFSLLLWLFYSTI